MARRSPLRLHLRRRDAHKYKDANCDGQLDPSDPPVPGWWLCMVTPEGDTICRQTGPDGQVCFSGIPLGHYTVFEDVPPGWLPVGPTSFEVDLTSGEVVHVTFLNVRYDECYGACCLPSGQCVEVTPERCAELFGEFQGLGTTCTAVQCPQPGACCFDDGTCEYLLEEQCLAAPGHVIWLGPGVTCTPTNPCEQPGACCNLETGACVFVLQRFCTPPLVWFGGPCTPNPCPQRGACCDPATGVCYYILQDQCVPPLVWYGGTCEPVNPCPPPPPTGACCFIDGSCLVLTEAECTRLGGFLWVPEEDCVEDCPPVPTENTTWGKIKATYR